MVGTHLAALAILPPAVVEPGTTAGAAGAGVLLLWLWLAVAVGLMLFWGVPIATAALISRGQEQHPANVLLWAGLLGWFGLLVVMHRGAAKQCPHCHARVVAETTFCYWCEGDTRPAPLPEWLRS